MSAINLQKLDRIIERFAGVEHALSSGATGEAFVKNSKDYAELAPMAKGAQALKAAYAEREGLTEMLAGGGELAQIDASLVSSGKTYVVVQMRAD